MKLYFIFFLLFVLTRSIFGDDVVITGAGAITGLGRNLSDNWRGLRTGSSGISFTTLALGDPGIYLQRAGIPDIEACIRLMAGKKRPEMGQTFQNQLALAAAREAIVASGLGENTEGGAVAIHPPFNDWRINVIVGSSFGGALDNPADIGPKEILNRLPLAHSLISRMIGATEISTCVSSACVSSLHALLFGVDRLFSPMDPADAVLVAGTDDQNTPLGYQIRDALLAKDGRSRPFDSGSQGIVLGTGASAIVILRESRAREKGLRPLAKIKAVKAITGKRGSLEGNIEPLFVRDAIREALRQANLPAGTRLGVIGHGTGTGHDRHELKGLAMAIPEVMTGQIPVVSYNEHLGHLLGASSVFRYAIATRVFENNFLPGSLAPVSPYPEFRNVNFVGPEGYALPLDCIVSITNAMGAQYGAAVICRP